MFFSVIFGCLRLEDWFSGGVSEDFNAFPAFFIGPSLRVF